MSASCAPGDCTFCQYYDAHHNARRCHCAACFRRRSSAQAQSLPDASQEAPAASLPAAASASPITRARCPHAAVPFHQCKLCVLPPYFEHARGQWDGHAVVCAPLRVGNDGCGCSVACACRRRCSRRGSTSRVSKAAHARLQFAAHEVPVMGPRAALYVKK